MKIIAPRNLIIPDDSVSEMLKLTEKLAARSECEASIGKVSVSCMCEKCGETMSARSILARLGYTLLP